jgi:pimeloyl-ACP methyl ester carboxylesterase
MRHRIPRQFEFDEGVTPKSRSQNRSEAFRRGLLGVPRVPPLLRRGRDGRFHWHWDPRLLDWRTKEFPLRHARMVAAARGIEIPTLLVRGEHSDVLSEDGAQEFLDLVPHARYTVLQGAGHMVAGDRNDGFGDAALALLRNLPVAGS